MSIYNIQPTLNPNKVFILQKSELENDLTLFIMFPIYWNLKKKLVKTAKKLRNYVIKFSSGARYRATEKTALKTINPH